MDEIVKQYEEFLRTIIRDYLLPGSKGTIPGVMGKPVAASSFSADYDTKASDKIDELVNSAPPGTDTAELKAKLSDKANEVYRIFTTES